MVEVQIKETVETPNLGTKGGATVRLRLIGRDSVTEALLTSQDTCLLEGARWS